LNFRRAIRDSLIARRKFLLPIDKKERHVTHQPTIPPRQRVVIGSGLLLLGLLIWLIRAPLHSLPLERDEGAYAVMARDWLAGSVPYRDRFDHKPPFVYAAYVPATLLPGDPVLAIRRWATIWLLATAGATWWAARRLWRSEPAGLIAALVFASWASGIMVQGITFNSEAVMLLPAVLALGAGLRALESGHPTRWWLLAGAMAALAILSKPIGVFLLPAILLAPLAGRAGWRTRWRESLAVAGGMLLVAAPLALYLLLAGAWDAAVGALWTYNLRYAAESTQQNTLGFIPTLWPVWRPLLPLALVAGLGGAVGVPGQRRAAQLVALGWGLGLIVGALASLRPYPHYYLATVPALALGAGGLGRLRLPRRQAVAALAAIAIALGFCLPPLATLTPYRSEAPAAQIERLYGVDGREFFALAPKVVSWIDRNVGPQATLWVWAAEPEIYLLGRRPVPTRFPYDYPLAVLPGARAEVLAALRQNPPQVIVTYGEVRPEGFGELQHAYGYVMRVHLGGYDIWVRAAQ
jgi:4-amino-4-deoxy-L-arabinose transferase-like glycosyltransferase